LFFRIDQLSPSPYPTLEIIPVASYFDITTKSSLIWAQESGTSLPPNLYQKSARNGMIEILMTDIAKTKLLEILGKTSSKVIRIIQHGYG
jgi:hypothetical protein